MNFTLLKQTVHHLVSVSEEEIRQALGMVHKHLDMVVEPSAAVGLAAALVGKLDICNRRVGFILTGGNIDAGAFHNLI